VALGGREDSRPARGHHRERISGGASLGRPLSHEFDLIRILADIAFRHPDIVVVLQIEPKLTVVPSAFDKRRAVSAVTPVSSLASRSMRVRGTPHTFASAPADISSGMRIFAGEFRRDAEAEAFA
jgi:hypothetical protein